MREKNTTTSVLQTKAELEDRKARYEVCCTFDRGDSRENVTGFEFIVLYIGTAS